MKRVFALIICLTLCTCIFAACGDDEIYDRPGNGTTLGSTPTEPSIGDDNGSYSADPDGDVSQTTDQSDILEDGMNDLEQGVDDLEDGIEQGMDDLGDMMDGDGESENGTNGGNNGSTGTEGMNGANGSDGTDANGSNGPTGNGSTNGNSH